MREQLGHSGLWSGKDWPQFETRGGYRSNRDGRPLIYCVPMGWHDPFIITVERWMQERQSGGIVRLEE